MSDFGFGRPPRTAEALDLERVWDLGDALDEAKGDREVDPALMGEVAEAEGAPLAHMYVAAGMDPELPWKAEHPVTFIVCTGECQSWSAVERVQWLLEERQRRLDAGQPAFDIQARGCLNACDHPPAIVSQGPEGLALHPNATPESLGEAIAVRVDGESLED